jgi:hypothetical protein
MIRSVCASDLDGDHDIDLATTGTTGRISILLGNGDGTFANAVDYDTPAGSASICSSDLDGDGDNDLAVANDAPAPGDGDVSVVFNNGDGTFQSPVYYSAGERARSICSHDFDHDGDYDLVVANGATHTMTVLLNNGDGTFLRSFEYGVGIEPASIVAVDVDRDGDKDLAVANEESDNVTIILNRTR